MEVRLQPLRRLRCAGTLAIATAALASCHRGGHVAPRGAHYRFLHDRALRRAALEASLAKPHGTYATDRLARYATGDAQSWDRLPAWNPEVTSILERAGVVRDEGTWSALAITPAARRGDEAALRALGARAFSRYPAQAAAFDVGALTPARRRATGLWIDAQGQLAGLVRARHADGSTAVAMTCATCHAQPDPRPQERTQVRDGSNGSITPGLPNDALDLGALLVDAPLVPPLVRDEPAEARFLAWGPGRVDVTTGSGIDPLHIPDLRAVRFERHLQQSGAVVQRDVTSLAVRIETLLITSHGEAIRPPREVAVGLALYLWSLGDALPKPEWTSRGAQLFERTCGKCHEGDGLAGDLVPASKVRTDPRAARSPERGTGAYRATSLRGLGARGRLMHDASVRGLDDLLDPASPRLGHRYGLDLDQSNRVALRDWLEAL